MLAKSIVHKALPTKIRNECLKTIYCNEGAMNQSSKDCYSATQAFALKSSTLSQPLCSEAVALKPFALTLFVIRHCILGHSVLFWLVLIAFFLALYVCLSFRCLLTFEL